MSSPTILPEPKPRGSPPRFLHSGLCALNDQAALKLGQYADMGRPVGVSVSMASVSDLNFTPRCFKSSSIVMRSRRLRPNLSSFHTMSVSPSCRALRQRVSAGRFVVAPEMPLSLWIVLHPARFKAVSYMAEFWSSVEYFMPAFWNNKTGLCNPCFHWSRLSSRNLPFTRLFMALTCIQTRLDKTMGIATMERFLQERLFLLYPPAPEVLSA